MVGGRGAGAAGEASHTQVSGNTAVQRGDYDYLWGRGEGNEILALGTKLKGLLEKKKKKNSYQEPSSPG